MIQTRQTCAFCSQQAEFIRLFKLTGRCVLNHSVLSCGGNFAGRQFVIDGSWREIMHRVPQNKNKKPTSMTGIWELLIDPSAPFDLLDKCEALLVHNISPFQMPGSHDVVKSQLPFFKFLCLELPDDWFKEVSQRSQVELFDLFIHYYVFQRINGYIQEPYSFESSWGYSKTKIKVQNCGKGGKRRFVFKCDKTTGPSIPF